MWRERAAGRATVFVAAVVLAACAGWAVLAQTMTTPACALPTPPVDAGPLDCPTPVPSPAP